jgi:HD-GYP domain-containing protein (c-di-GMP phosphodiesterase class II)
MTARSAATADDGSTARYERLIEIGIALSGERNFNRLMEMILLEAKNLCNADGGTLYLRTEEDALGFVIMRTDSLGIALGGTTGKGIPFPPLKMIDPESGEPNHKNVATHVALSGETINIEDAYVAEDFDFAGTKKFDQGTGYRSKSFLTVPLKNHQGEVTGVLQLLNALDPRSGEVIAFDPALHPVIEALASQAAVALDNQQLIEAQRRLLDSFIQLMANAIDAKSPYTGGHCQRVPELTKMLAGAACESKAPPFAEFELTDEEWYEVHIAAWLHDCGKVTTPEYVVDKATKLQTMYDRIHEIRTRFEVVKRDAEIACLKGILAGGDAAALMRERDARLAGLDDDFAFVAECNLGGEFMAPERLERLRRIADIEWTRTLDDRLGLSHEEAERRAAAPANPPPHVEPLLADRPEHVIPRGPADRIPPDNPYGFKLDVPEHKYNLGEVYNLAIARGTLTAEERFKINDHIVQTIVMLEQLPFPKTLRRVPEYAGGHHETMIGTGYPRRLTREEMSLPARIMAVADIFEALTASDRPYKKAKTLSESLRIMSFMRNDRHIDPELFELFLRSGVYKAYAERFLAPEQIDAVDIEAYLKSAA